MPLALKSLRRALPLLLCVVPIYSQQFVPNRYTLILQDPPVATRYSTRAEMQSAAAANYQAQIEARQRAVMTQLAARQIRVTGSTSTLINAVFVTTTPDHVADMLAVPGVLGVRPMRRLQLFLNRATQLMNAPAAWAMVGGQSNAGAGIKIGVLDTGIDQTHPAFQDSSLSMPAGFPKCDSYNQPNCAQYTNSKVIVARSYVKQIAASFETDPANPAAQSQPDDYSPRDRLGHGTAVASAAAGVVNTGPAQSATGGNITFSGMAPKAYLGNYKLWGTPGVNDGWGATEGAMIQALTDAFTDGMDIVTTSLGESPALSGALDTGSACGEPAGVQCDPLAYAFEMAAQKGMVVTVAAGNGGSDAPVYPYFNSISSPATAPSVIAVGATLNSHALTTTVSANAANAASNLKNIAAQPGDSAFDNIGCTTSCFPTAGANTAPLVDVSQIGDGYACSALPPGSLNGAFALVERGPSANPCAFSVKANNAAAAGAIGIIFYMYDSTVPFPPGGLTFAGPAVMISNSDGVNLKNYIDANAGQPVTIDTAGQEVLLSTYDSQNGLSLEPNQLASYSSFGPSPDGLIKPDMVATGGLDPLMAFDGGMYLAAQNFDPNGDVYSSNRYVAAAGTSFATPIVAGAAALVKQAHPKYTVAEIKSALVNFSAQDTTTDDGNSVNFGSAPQTVTVEWMGAGRLDAGAASGATLAVQPATVSFGYLQSGIALPAAKTLTVTNQGSAAVTLSVAVTQVPSGQAAAVSVTQPSITVPAGGSATVNVNAPSTVPAAGSYTGQITFTASGLALHVPYMFLVGDGIPYNLIPFAGGEGTAGEDIGPNFAQVVDQYGVPVAGTAVTFSARPGAVTFNSCTMNNCGFVPPACTGSGTSTVTCNTDNYGFAYADTVFGAQGTPVVTVRAGSMSFPNTALVLPQPTISQILDNAAFQPVIAPGSIVAIKGANMVDPNNLINTCDQSTTSPYPLVLDGVNISFDVASAGISVPAPIVGVCAGQVNVQAPWELAGQSSAQVKVIIDELIDGQVATATVATYTPAFFTYGSNTAIALDTSYHLIGSSNAAVRGQSIQLFANGLGPVNNTPADGFPAPDGNSTTTQPCSITIGGVSVNAEFCGLAPGLAIYQVNVKVPTSISAGTQPITVTVGGKTSPSGVTIPVQ